MLMVMGLRDHQGDPRAGDTTRLARDNAVLRAEVDRLVRENQRLQTRVRELAGHGPITRAQKKRPWMGM
jgi:cell division protein FtsB